MPRAVAAEDDQRLLRQLRLRAGLRDGGAGGEQAEAAVNTGYRFDGPGYRA